MSDENRRAQMRETIGQRKLEEEWNRYLRDMRDEAYVDIRTDEAAAGSDATTPATQPATTPTPPAATPPVTPAPKTGG